MDMSTPDQFEREKKIFELALDLLAGQGYDPEMGARPLRRVIQQKVEDPLSDALLSGAFQEGDTILVEAAEGEIVLRRQEKTPEAEKVAEPSI